jgi:hypothetical protein
MYSADSLPFRLACLSLYGRTNAIDGQEVEEVCNVISRRRKLLREYEGLFLSVLLDAFGMNKDQNDG